MLYIFDIGGVCTSDAAEGFNKLYDILGLSKESFDKFCDMPDDVSDEAFFEKSLFGKLCNGFIDEKTFWQEFSKRSGIKVTANWFHLLFLPERKDDTYELIKLLKNRGNRVVAGSNTIDGHYLNHLERGDYQIFDKTYVSNYMGVSKPSLDFWKIIMTSEGVKASDCIFIDDKEVNVKAAESLGIKAFVFTSAEKLKKDLMLL